MGESKVTYGFSTACGVSAPNLPCCSRVNCVCILGSMKLLTSMWGGGKDFCNWWSLMQHFLSYLINKILHCDAALIFWSNSSTLTQRCYFQVSKKTILIPNAWDITVLFYFTFSLSQHIKEMMRIIHTNLFLTWRSCRSSFMQVTWKVSCIDLTSSTFLKNIAAFLGEWHYFALTVRSSMSNSKVQWVA